MPHSAPACDEAQMVWLLPVDWWPLLSDRGRMLRGFSILVLSLLLLARPVMAQQILRDAETEALFNSISAPLEEAAGLDPRNVQVLLINDPEINAFVAGGQIVWIHSGLLAKADNVNQLQGVIAHELGHIERSEEHTSELQSLMRISYAVFGLKKKINKNKKRTL